ncbi:MAG: hypothetical protein MUQ30_01260 [Anaerolineae bacterium]|nr:hypothetical protein [Anaerolineae bacterium]
MLRRYRTMAILLVALAVFVPLTSAGALSIGGVMKGAGIAKLVTLFADQLDSTINKLTANKNLPSTAATKVVPIVSLGQGSYVGAAQVSGPTKEVAKVNFVVQIEGTLGKNFRMNALVPVEGSGITDMSRVQGVGVSATIDVKM